MKTKYKPLTLTSIMPFGKFKGDKISDLVVNQAWYVEWLIENTEVKFDETVLFCLENPNLTKGYIPKEEDEDAWSIMINNHPNPFKLNYKELGIAVRCSYHTITKKGNPTIDDWDKEVYDREEHLNITQPNRNLYGSI